MCTTRGTRKCGLVYPGKLRLVFPKEDGAPLRKHLPASVSLYYRSVSPALSRRWLITPDPRQQLAQEGRRVTPALIVQMTSSSVIDSTCLMTRDRADLQRSEEAGVVFTWRKISHSSCPQLTVTMPSYS